MDHLNVDGMKGRRIGVLESLFGKEEINESTNKVVRNALKVFEENGATLVPVTDNIDQPWLTSEVSVHLDDFQHDLDGHLAHPARRLEDPQHGGDSGKRACSIPLARAICAMP